MSNSESVAQARISSLLDANSFVELMASVTSRATDINPDAAKADGDGVVIGYGLIGGSPVYVFAQDSAVLGGTIGEMHAKKILSVYDKALAAGVPVVGILDCGGVRIQESVDGLDALGQVIAKACEAKGRVLQLMVVAGNCGGGLTSLASIADFAVMTKDASFYVTSPDAIKGNRTEVCDSASGEFRVSEAGDIDFVGTEAEVFAKVRDLIEVLPAAYGDEGDFADCADDINRASAGIESMEDAAAVAAELADSHKFVEVGAGYSEDIVTGFITLDGVTVGVVGSKAAALSAEGVAKAADFIEYLDSFEIPVLTLVNVNGYKAAMCCEKRLPRELAKLALAYSNTDIPKVTLILGEAVGTSALFLGSKSMGADYVLALPNVTVGPMTVKEASKVLDDTTCYSAGITGGCAALAHGYIDKVVNGADARKYLIAGVEMLLGKTRR